MVALGGGGGFLCARYPCTPWYHLQWESARLLQDGANYNPNQKCALEPRVCLPLYLSLARRARNLLSLASYQMVPTQRTRVPPMYMGCICRCSPLLAPSDILPAALPLLLPLDPGGLGRQILHAESETSALLIRCAALGRALLTETKVESGVVSKQKWTLC